MKTTKQEYTEIYNYSFSLYEESLKNGLLFLKKEVFSENEAVVFKSIINLSAIILRATEKSLINNKIKFDHLANGRINLDWYSSFTKEFCIELSDFCEDESPKKRLNKDILGQQTRLNIPVENIKLMDRFDFNDLLYKLILSLDHITILFLSDYKEVEPSKYPSIYIRRMERNKAFFEPLISDLVQLQNAFFKTKNHQIFCVSKIGFFRRLYCHWIGEKTIKEIRNELNLFDISFESKIMKA